jgi:predicted DNA-binding transcriptional regulator AlpA
VDMPNSDEKTRLRAVPDDGWWTAAEVAEWLGLSPDWVWKQVREKSGLPFLRLSARCVRFPVKALKEWAARRVVQ